MDRDKAVRLLSEEAGAFAALLDGCETKPVPTCPDWTMTDLAVHLGRVYARAAAIIGSHLTEPPPPQSLPRPEEGEPLVSFLERHEQGLLEVLGSVEEETRCWNFLDGSTGAVSFWPRRLFHETLIHRLDAELAAGRPPRPVSRENAQDGVEEFLVLARLSAVPWDDLVLGGAMTIHLHATDLESEWTIDTGSSTFARAHLKTDVALRGPAWSLDRWLWGRLAADDAEGSLEPFGDLAAAENWRPRL